MGTYRIDRSYDWNYENGPSYDGPWPRVPRTPGKEFLGIPVHSRLGIAAGLLLNADWIKLYSRLGFDILTYKTVRVRARQCQPLPNWVVVDAARPLDGRAADEVLARRRRRPRDTANITSAVSFGMPSKAPGVWQADVARARKALPAGQALVVSVVASPLPGDGPSKMVAQYGLLAELARDAGAQVVEANLSCPNVCTAEGNVFLDPDLSGQVARAMRRSAADLPITLKAGYFADPKRLGRFLRQVSGWVDGVVLVNGMSRRVVDPDGSPAFGPGREVVGVLGRGIHAACLANVRSAMRAIERDKLELRVLAVGGVLAEADVEDYRRAGAHAVLMGGGPMFDPGLAVRFKRAHPEW